MVDMHINETISLKLLSAISKCEVCTHNTKLILLNVNKVDFEIVPLCSQGY